jgi:hypothetical protein
MNSPCGNTPSYNVLNGYTSLNLSPSNDPYFDFALMIFSSDFYNFYSLWRQLKYPASFYPNDFNFNL